jgi:hypothetical protein
MSGGPRGAAYTLGLFLVVVALAAVTADLSPVARWVPVVVLAPALALLALQLALDLAPGATRGLDRLLRGQMPTLARDVPMPARPATPVAATLRTTLLPLGILVSILALGLIAGTALATLLYVRRVGGRSWPRSIAVALALAAVLWLVFELALNVPLFGASWVEALWRAAGRDA